MTEITHNSRNIANAAEIKCSPNAFNNHFLSLYDEIPKSTETPSVHFTREESKGVLLLIIIVDVDVGIIAQT